MKFVTIHTKLLLFGLLLMMSTCGQKSGTLSPTTAPGTTPIVSTPVSTNAPPPDSLRWVSYVVSDLQTDTILFARPESVGMMDDAALVEASGLAPSRQNPGYLWTEEDSGNPSQIQLISEKGTVVGRYALPGLTNRDWEDMAVGPGPVSGKSYIYLADIGDNKERYATKFIYRFPEPAIAGKTMPVEEVITAVETISLQLPDGPKNAEAILVDPTTLDLYLLSKEDRSVLYKAAYPQSLTQPITMQRLLAMPFDKVTSAGISPDGKQLLIRTYGQLFYYRRQAGESVVDALKQAPRLVPLANEPQGEAVGWAIDGQGYYTTSEKPDAQPQVIYFYRRKP